MAKGRVFILESPNPTDLLEGRGESLSLEQVCRLAGYNAKTFLLRDRKELIQTCNYLATIKGKKTDTTPLFLHISGHGSEDALGFGPDAVGWDDLATIIQNMYTSLRYYHGHVVIILSACLANHQKLTDHLESLRAAVPTDKRYVPPEFIFVFGSDTVTWVDAVVTWTIFYREMTKADLKDKTTIQALLKKLHDSGFGSLKYFRWTGQSYATFEPKVKGTS